MPSTQSTNNAQAGEQHVYIQNHSIYALHDIDRIKGTAMTSLATPEIKLTKFEQ